MMTVVAREEWLRWCHISAQLNGLHPPLTSLPSRATLGEQMAKAGATSALATCFDGC